VVVPQLVGSWTQDRAGPSGNYVIRSEYTFAPDGNYALVDELCPAYSNGVDCLPDETPEAGVAVTNGNQLLLSPTTDSELGFRTYTFVVVGDVKKGDVRLQFIMPDHVDEWFWVPPS
jgi:hypothetical protein